MGLKPVIDKVEVRIPAAAPYSEEFSRVYSEHCGDPRIFRPSQHYLRAGDLRGLGYQSILHAHCLHGKASNHKLELIDTGELSFLEIQREIQRVFDVDPWQLGVMRIDLAADIPGVPVSWFARNTRVKWKQWGAELGKLEYATMGRRKVETLYFGKRPNCVRTYDKISEFRHQYQKMLRRASDAAEIPSFEEKFHYPETGFVLTRVERQIAGGRLPLRFDTIGKLRRLPEFNPFEHLELLQGDRPEPNIDDYGVMEYYTGMGLRAAANEMGIQRLRAQLNQRSSGNASRIFRMYEHFLPGAGGVDGEQLVRRYRESVCRQLAA